MDYSNWIQQKPDGRFIIAAWDEVSKKWVFPVVITETGPDYIDRKTVFVILGDCLSISPFKDYPDKRSALRRVRYVLSFVLPTAGLNHFDLLEALKNKSNDKWLEDWGRKLDGVK